jgi:LacI family transcriptional regulator
MMVPAVPAEVVRALLPRSLPVVLLSSTVPAHQNCHSITVDNAGGAYEAVRHLAAHGHRRIAMLLGPAGNHDAQERQRGYHAALREAGLEQSPELEVPGDFTGAAGYAGALTLRALADPPTAIFAANDALALGALSALRERGVRVPETMAVAGFDNVSSSQYSVPALTTVEVAISELGARAVRRLVGALRAGSEAAPEAEALPATVVVRRSCGCD